MFVRASCSASPWDASSGPAEGICLLRRPRVPRALSPQTGRGRSRFRLRSAYSATACPCACSTGCSSASFVRCGRAACSSTRGSRAPRRTAFVVRPWATRFLLEVPLLVRPRQAVGFLPCALSRSNRSSHGWRPLPPLALSFGRLRFPWSLLLLLPVGAAPSVRCWTSLASDRVRSLLLKTPSPAAPRRRATRPLLRLPGQSPPHWSPPPRRGPVSSMPFCGAGSAGRPPSQRRPSSFSRRRPAPAASRRPGLPPRAAVSFGRRA